MSTYPADFISGAITMGFLVIALFFLRFWRRTKDSLFLIFAIAFCLLALNAATFSLGAIARGEAWVYLLRLVAFGLIIAAILSKNLRAR